MPETEAVKQALRTLAVGESPSTEGDAALVRRATATLEDVRAAAAFRAAGDLTELAAAVDRAAARGDHALVRRGRRTLAGFERFQRAARGDAKPAVRPPRHHFRSGHGTPLSDAGQAGDR